MKWVLTVEDTTTGEKIDLPKGDKVDIPVYRATFAFKGAPLGKEFLKGDTLQLDGTEITLKVTKIDESSVELEATEKGGQPKTIKKPLGSP